METDIYPTYIVRGASLEAALKTHLLVNCDPRFYNLKTIVLEKYCILYTHIYESCDSCYGMRCNQRGAVCSGRDLHKEKY